MNAIYKTPFGVAAGLLCSIFSISGCDSSVPADEATAVPVSAPAMEFDTAEVEPPFDPAHFQPIENDTDHWDWPSMAEFETNWNRATESLTTPGLVSGQMRYEPDEGIALWGTCDIEQPVESSDVILEFVHHGGKTLFRALTDIEEASQGSFEESMVAIDLLDEELSQAHYESGCGELILKPDYVVLPGVPNERELVAYVYAETLLDFGDDLYDDYETSEEVLECHRQSGGYRSAAAWGKLADRNSDCYQMVYDVVEGNPRFDRDIAEQRDAHKRRIERLFALNIPGSNRTWGTALRSARQWGDHELEYRISRRYRPINDCGGDTSSQRASIDYENLCARLGKTGCFLQLRDENRHIPHHLQKERDNATLKGAQTPVNPELFWRGRSLRFTGGDSLHPATLAGIVTNSEPWLLDVLVDMAQDSELDGSSRLHATKALHAAELPESLGDLDLTPAARSWLNGAD